MLYYRHSQRKEKNLMKSYKVKINHHELAEVEAHNARDAVEAYVFNTEDGYTIARKLAAYAHKGIIEASGEQDYYKAVYNEALTEIEEEEAGNTALINTEEPEEMPIWL